MWNDTNNAVPMALVERQRRNVIYRRLEMDGQGFRNAQFLFGSGQQSCPYAVAPGLGPYVDRNDVACPPTAGFGNEETENPVVIWLGTSICNQSKRSGTAHIGQ